MAGAEEIIEDYASGLEWLQTNDRYAINNFTVIAKENTEHADAISSALVDHITKAHPNHKLPALYVLDSIAKNIGTPYTLFLGHRLYGTFMGAYSLVDNATRKKLDEMLKTWKSPVPGSLDSRPVFDATITKRIENALIQAKTKTLQVEQRQQREQQDLLRRRAPGTVASQWRNTPTPPQSASQFPVPSSHGFLRYEDAENTNSNTSSIPIHPTHMLLQGSDLSPLVSNLQPIHLKNSYQFPDFNQLEQDVQELIDKFHHLVVHNQNDAGMQIKLKALRDLQTVLKSQDLPPDQLQAVRTQVDALQTQLPQIQAHSDQNQNHLPAFQNISASNQAHFLGHSQSLYQQQVQPLQASTPPAPNTPINPSALSIPSSDFLANLLASRNTVLQNPPLSHYPPRSSDASSSTPLAGTSTSSENPLLAQLRASGLLKPTLISEMTSPSPEHLTQKITPSLLDLSALIRPPLAERPNDIEMSAASLKIFRPNMIEKIYGEQPNQCLTCGKRFAHSDEGKVKKARHMDWHFRTNQRLAESSQKGQSRSWYVDEVEWIKFRDLSEELGGTSERLVDVTAPGDLDISKTNPRNMFIRVPSENDSPCGICQEKFVPSWSERLQDFVWMDAVKIGERIYHATCYQDFKKDESNTPARIATPDSVLGKRKAEFVGENPSPAKRIVTES